MFNSNHADRFIFHGTGREYFKIWIVNLLLTIATLGIYAAWAKVRTRKYFYQSTELNGSRFDYHADPKAILKGNLLVASIALVYIVLSYFAPPLAGVIFLLLMVLAPLFLVLSLRFHLANSSYKGLRFQFNGTAKKAYGKLVVATLICLGFVVVLGMVSSVGSGLIDFENSKVMSITLLVATPLLLIGGIAFMSALFASGLRLFVMNHSQFGNAELKCSARFEDFGKITLVSALLAGLVMLALAAAAFVMNVGVFTDGFDIPSPAVDQAPLPQDEASQEQARAAMQAMTILSGLGAFTLLGYLTLFALGAYLKTAIDNLVWNNTKLADQHQFKSTANPFVATWVYISNLFLIVCTIGLFLPFARIRSTRLRMNNMAFLPQGSIDEIVQGAQVKHKALGDSMGDALGLELGF